MQKPKILIVDDELTHLEAIMDIIEETGDKYRVLKAFNGKTAFKIAEKETLSLIITDWEMPGMSGIELIKQLKSNEKTKDIPIIMCTGVMTTSENLATSLEAGAVDYVRKPVDKIELPARINSMLKLSESYQKIKEQNHQLELQKEEIQSQAEQLSLANHELSKLSIVASETNNAIIIMDATGNFQWVNRAFSNLFGYSYDEFIKKFGKNISDTSVNPEIKELIAKCISSKESVNYVCINTTKSGKQLWIQTTLSPVINEQEEVANLVAIDSDVTLIKEAEIKIKEQNQTLAELNATKDKFFSIIAHDLRNSFTGILGFSKMITKNIKEANYGNLGEYSGYVYQAAQKSFDLLNNLLQWSLIQTGRLEFNPKLVVLQDIVSNITQLLEANLKTKQLKLSINIEPGLKINADKFMLETVIRNLISNAIKYTPTNGVIEIAASQTEKEFKISITDSGIGISKKNIDKLFKIESNFSTNGTNQEEGTGLGLILCKEFVEKHNGKIWIESEENKGTSFIFTISRNAKW